MSDSFNNPFSSLGKQLKKPEKTQNGKPQNGKSLQDGKSQNSPAGGAEGKALPAAKPAQPAKNAKVFGRKGQAPKPQDESEDAQLFAEAMRNVTAQDMKRHGKGKEGHGGPATKMQAEAFFQNDFAGARGGKAGEASPRNREQLADNAEGESFAELFAGQGEKIKQGGKIKEGGKARPGEKVQAGIKDQNAVAQTQPQPGQPKFVERGRKGLEAIEKRWLDENFEAAPSASEHEQTLFAKAMQGVKPVSAGGRDINKPAAPAGPAIGQPARDPNALLTDFLQGKLEFALEFTEEFIQGHVLGLDPLVMNKLKAGQYSPEANLDLHGLNAVQAYNSLTWFIRDAYQRGMRTVIVVTGRGKNSPDGIGVLRESLQEWLTRDPFKRVVLAFCTAQPCDGGAGAVYVALRKYKKNNGKIQWDMMPTEEELLL